ncbi:MAG: response regulator transcription factor [Patescibacteria group bacterium]|jgi:DNA-binding response OmpR family regulator
MSKILIVEDNKDILNIYKKELEYNKYDVESAETGQSGIDLIEKDSFDLIILDIMLPDMSGIDLLKKAKEKDKKQKVVMLTNVDIPAVVNDAYANGADGYLIKAELLPTQVVEEIQRYLNE